MNHYTKTKKSTAHRLREFCSQEPRAIGDIMEKFTMPGDSVTFQFATGTDEEFTELPQQVLTQEEMAFMDDIASPEQNQRLADLVR